MNITESKHGNVCTYVLEGNLDTGTSPLLEERLADLTPDITEIVLDLTDLTYLSSAGLRTILLARETLGDGGVITVKGANPMVMDIFDTTGFSAMLHVI